MTLADIDVWTENWLEQTGQQTRPGPPSGNGHDHIGAGFEEYHVG